MVWTEDDLRIQDTSIDTNGMMLNVSVTVVKSCSSMEFLLAVEQIINDNCIAGYDLIIVDSFSSFVVKDRWLALRAARHRRRQQETEPDDTESGDDKGTERTVYDTETNDDAMYNVIRPFCNRA